MPVQHTILQIFVASPSDVSEERQLLQGVVAELNRTWADSLGVTYRVYGWDINVTPGFGTEPQSVINSQIPADYDVFVGIFWGRLGNPTHSFSSGTVEEFEHAFSRHAKNGTPEIMIYFKDAPLPPSKIDPNQLQKLFDFKTSLGSRGGLFSTFEDQDGFEASLRSHLSAVARKFSADSHAKQRKLLAHTPPISDAPWSIEEDQDDFGYLDYIDIYVSEAEKITNCLKKIAELTSEIGKKLTKRTEQIKSAEGNTGKARAFMLMSANDMIQYSSELDGQLEIYSAAKTNSFDALSKSVSLHNEIIGKNETLINLQVTLKQLVSTIDESRIGILEMRDSAAGLPRMIKEVNKAKRTIIASLDRLLAEIDNTLATSSNIVESIEQMV